MFDSYAELGFVTISTILILAVATIYGFQINQLNNHSCTTAQLKTAAQMSSVAANTLLRSVSFGSVHRREKQSVCEKSEAAKQDAFVQLEKMVSNLALGQDVQIQVMDIEGQVFADSKHAAALTHTQRPMSKVSNSAVAEEIVKSSEMHEGGQYLPSSNGGSYVIKLPDYPSLILLVSLRAL